jgi:hypothetical protein
MEVAALDKYFPPQFNSNQFHCPWCHVYASQEWSELYPKNNPTLSLRWVNDSGNIRPASFIKIAVCAHCGRSSLWAVDQLLIPATSTVPSPHELMSDNVSLLYREVLPTSSKSAAALLRLAVQILVAHLTKSPPTTN